MIQLTPHMRILVAVEPADFRKGIDGLAGLCRQQLRQDPFNGTLFVFRNRRGRASGCVTSGYRRVASDGGRKVLHLGRGFWRPTSLGCCSLAAILRRPGGFVPGAGWMGDREKCKVRTRFCPIICLLVLIALRGVMNKKRKKFPKRKRQHL